MAGMGGKLTLPVVSPKLIDSCLSEPLHLRPERVGYYFLVAGVGHFVGNLVDWAFNSVDGADLVHVE